MLAVLKERVQAVAGDALHTMCHRSAVPLVRVCLCFASFDCVFALIVWVRV